MPRRPDPEVRQWWRELLDAFDSQAEDWTVSEFCQRHGVSTASFYNWRRRLTEDAEPRSRSGDAPAFIPIRLAPQQAALQGTVHVHLPGGAWLELPAEERELLLNVIDHITVSDAEVRP